MKNVYFRITNSYKIAQENESAFYSRLTGEQRLNMLEFCRQQFYKLKGINKDAIRKRFRETIRVVK